MFTLFPKLVKFHITLCLDPCYIFLLARRNKEFQKITSDDYFWQLKLFHDYPQFKHSKPYNLEHYKRLHMGRAEFFILTKEDTKDIVFTEEEREEYELFDNTREKIKNIALSKFNCIRGDVILIKEIEDMNDFGTVIFDGENMLNMEFPLYSVCPPKEFQTLVEFPLKYWNILHLGVFPFCPKSVTIYSSLVTNQCIDPWLFIYVPFMVDNNVYYALYNPDRLYKMDSNDIDKQKIINVFNTIAYAWINREYTLPLPLTDDNTIVFGYPNADIWT